MAGHDDEQELHQTLLNDAIQDLCYQQQLLAYNMSLLQCQFQTSFASLKDTVEQYMWSLSASATEDENIKMSDEDVESSEEEEEEEEEQDGNNKENNMVADERSMSILYNPQSLAGYQIDEVFVEWYRYDFDAYYSKKRMMCLPANIRSNIRRIRKCIGYMHATIPELTHASREVRDLQAFGSKVMRAMQIKYGIKTCTVSQIIKCYRGYRRG